jgi:transcriptional regulator with XRE-family HTH domain
LGAWVLAQRTKAGLTQQELADRARVSRQLVMRVENGALRSEFWKVLSVIQALGGDISVADAQEVQAWQ